MSLSLYFHACRPVLNAFYLTADFFANIVWIAPFCYGYNHLETVFKAHVATATYFLTLWPTFICFSQSHNFGQTALDIFDINTPSGRTSFYRIPKCQTADGRPCFTLLHFRCGQMNIRRPPKCILHKRAFSHSVITTVHQSTSRASTRNL